VGWGPIRRDVLRVGAFVGAVGVLCGCAVGAKWCKAMPRRCSVSAVSLHLALAGARVGSDLVVACRWRNSSRIDEEWPMLRIGRLTAPARSRFYTSPFSRRPRRTHPASATPPSNRATIMAAWPPFLALALRHTRRHSLDAMAAWK
jgi:hypothetical protein